MIRLFDLKDDQNPSYNNLIKKNVCPANFYTIQKGVLLNQDSCICNYLVVTKEPMKLINRKKMTGYLISLINRYTQIYLGKELKPYEMGAGQGVFLGEIFISEGKSQDELSALIKIDKATAARSLAKLEDKGYIIRKTDPSDKRFRRVYLTNKAKKFAPIHFAIFNAWSENLVHDFSREEKEQLLFFLERMGQNAITKLEK